MGSWNREFEAVRCFTVISSQLPEGSKTSFVVDAHPEIQNLGWGSGLLDKIQYEHDLLPQFRQIWIGKRSQQPSQAAVVNRFDLVDQNI